MKIIKENIQGLSVCTLKFIFMSGFFLLDIHKSQVSSGRGGKFYLYHFHVLQEQIVISRVFTAENLSNETQDT